MLNNQNKTNKIVTFRDLALRT